MSEKATATRSSLLKAKAQAVASEASGASGVTFDPAIIITLITTLLGILGVCKTPKQAVAEMRSPGRVTYFVLRRECRLHAPDHDAAEVLVAAVLDQAGKLTEPEMAAAYAEAGVALK